MWNFIWWVRVSSRPTFGVLIVYMFEGVHLYSVWLDNNVSAILLLPHLHFYKSSWSRLHHLFRLVDYIIIHGVFLPKEVT